MVHSDWIYFCTHAWWNHYIAVAINKQYKCAYVCFDFPCDVEIASMEDAIFLLAMSEQESVEQIKSAYGRACIRRFE